MVFLFILHYSPKSWEGLRRTGEKTPKEVEKNGGKKITKAGVPMHCSICKREGHNRKGHEKYIQEQANNGSVLVEDENGDVDNQTILQVIFEFNGYCVLLLQIS